MGGKLSRIENRKLSQDLKVIEDARRNSFAISIPDDIKSYHVKYHNREYIAIADYHLSQAKISLDYRIQDHNKIKYFDQNLRELFPNIVIVKNFFAKRTYRFPDNNSMNLIVEVLTQYLNKN